MHQLIEKADHIAEKQHAHQTRKFDDTPRISHPRRVCAIVHRYWQGQNPPMPVVAAAALLHDVIEDTHGYTLKDMERDFGNNVADIVDLLTEPHEDTPDFWLANKHHYLSSLRAAIKNYGDVGKAALIIACADKLDNLDYYIGLFRRCQDDECRKRHTQKPKKMFFYGEVARVAREMLGDRQIVRVLEARLQEAWKIFKFKEEEVSDEVRGLRKA